MTETLILLALGALLGITGWSCIWVALRHLIQRHREPDHRPQDDIAWLLMGIVFLWGGVDIVHHALI